MWFRLCIAGDTRQRFIGNLDRVIDQKILRVSTRVPVFLREPVAQGFLDLGYFLHG